MNELEDEAIGQLATDAVQRGFLSVRKPDPEHPAWQFWDLVTKERGFPFVVMQTSPGGAKAALHITWIGPQVHPANRVQAEQRIASTMRRHKACKRLDVRSGATVGPLTTPVATALATAIARSTGVTFPLIDMERVR